MNIKININQAKKKYNNRVSFSATDESKKIVQEFAQKNDTTMGEFMKIIFEQVVDEIKKEQNVQIESEEDTWK
jgi:urate oxidase